MQSKPVSAAVEVATSVRAEMAFAPFLDATMIAGRADADDWLTLITMAPPNFLLVPLTRRSGDMAPLNVYRDKLLMVPCWISECFAGLISYQRTWAPGPPKTVCWVHSAVTDPCEGSTADSAWVGRVSRVSSLNEVPGWGAEAGT